MIFKKLKLIIGIMGTLICLVFMLKNLMRDRYLQNCKTSDIILIKKYPTLLIYTYGKLSELDNDSYITYNDFLYYTRYFIDSINKLSSVSDTLDSLNYIYVSNKKKVCIMFNDNSIQEISFEIKDTTFDFGSYLILNKEKHFNYGVIIDPFEIEHYISIIRKNNQ
jgi:hypothetical protein